MNEQMTFEEMLNAYLAYRTASKLKESTTLSLKTFFNTFRKNHPNAFYLTREMVETWCAKRDTECPASHKSRTDPTVSFINHAFEREWIDFSVQKIKNAPRNPYIPHAFNSEELTGFFRACGEIEPDRINYRGVRLRSIEVPVFFKLLYSSGLRPVEARLLRCENVNLSTGVIDVIFTKGYNEHRVVLHDTMLELLVQYDKDVSQIIPDRKIFFPTIKDTCHHRSWVAKQFGKAWNKYNKTYARSSDFRHFYAYMNINSWTNTGYEAHDKLLALSKSMGHTSLRSTLYYFSLVDTFGGLIEEHNGTFFNHIIPDLPDE